MADSAEITDAIASFTGTSSIAATASIAVSPSPAGSLTGDTRPTAQTIRLGSIPSTESVSGPNVTQTDPPSSLDLRAKGTITFGGSAALTDALAEATAELSTILAPVDDDIVSTLADLARIVADAVNAPVSIEEKWRRFLSIQDDLAGTVDPVIEMVSPEGYARLVGLFVAAAEAAAKVADDPSSAVAAAPDQATSRLWRAGAIMTLRFLAGASVGAFLADNLVMVGALGALFAMVCGLVAVDPMFEG